MTRAEPFEFVEASIEEVLEAFRSRKTTARLLLDQYLARIEAYDRGPDGLNSIVVMNPLAEAQADESDLRWNAGTARAFGGIPFTVKDSYMAQGLTVAAGSPAFRDLQAQWDAFTASKLRGAGAVLIGKTNMPPMADGGMQRGDFWRNQTVVKLPRPSQHRPQTYQSLANIEALRGKRFAMPAMYLGLDPVYPIKVRPSILEESKQAKARLERLGAEVVVTDVPLVTTYEGDRPGQKYLGKLGGLPPDWSEIEFSSFLEFGWDDFLRANGDSGFPSLGSVDSALIYPTPEGALPDRYERVGDHDDRFKAIVEDAREGIPDPRSHPRFEQGLRAITKLRESIFESWLTENGFDAVVFPANADVGPADSACPWGSPSQAPPTTTSRY